MEYFVAPHGGGLVNLLVGTEKVEALKTKSQQFLSLRQRQRCNLELLMNGAFSPLSGIMGRQNYELVVDNLRLVGGALWPIPIVLDMAENFAEKLRKDDQIVLRGGSYQEWLATQYSTPANEC